MKSVWTLQIDRDVQENVLVLALRGRLGSASTGALLAGIPPEGEYRAVLIDLEGVDYMSGAGLIALDAAAQRILEAGARLALSGACDPVRLVLEFGGLLSGVPIEPSRAAALERLRLDRT